MKKISYEMLIERLTQELTCFHNYTVNVPEDGLVIFQSPINSEFGEHTVLFNVFSCICDGIPFYIGQRRNLPNERIKILIHEFVTTVMNKLSVKISEENDTKLYCTRL